jgi:hypothetical protein
VASEWADRLLDITRLALSPDQGARGYFYGTPACFSALLRAERHGEILSLLEKETFADHRLDQPVHAQPVASPVHERVAPQLADRAVQPETDGLVWCWSAGRAAGTTEQP